MMRLVVVVAQGGVLLPLPGPGLLLPHAGARPLSCRHTSGQHNILQQAGMCPYTQKTGW